MPDKDELEILLGVIFRQLEDDRDLVDLFLFEHERPSSPKTVTPSATIDTSTQEKRSRKRKKPNPE
jgi:hypothetical protein